MLGDDLKGRMPALGGGGSRSRDGGTVECLEIPWCYFHYYYYCFILCLFIVLILLSVWLLWFSSRSCIIYIFFVQLHLYFRHQGGNKRLGVVV